MINMKGALAVIVTALACAIPLVAHHSVAASYDTSKTLTVTGVNTNVEWRNPHVILHLGVKNSEGSVTEWRMEMRGANSLSASGVNQIAIAPGSQVAARIWIARDGTKYGNVRSLLMPDGRNLDGNPSRQE
jgi:Family of unknown function (DUF6152)